METTWIERALALARQELARGGAGPVGAVVVRAGVVVGEGVNRSLVDRDPTAHAEMVALRAAARHLDTTDLSDCALYVSCEPCPMCFTATLWAGIGTLAYAADRHDTAAAGLDDDRLYRLVATAPGERGLDERRLCVDEGRAILRAWRQRMTNDE